jgi:hypothetical protein
MISQKYFIYYKSNIRNNYFTYDMVVFGLVPLSELQSLVIPWGWTGGEEQLKPDTHSGQAGIGFG